MTDDDFAKVDAYIEERLLGADPVLAAVLKANADGGLPAIDVSPAQGRLLTVYARMTNAKRILEIGTLGGYSTICMARGLPADGHIDTCEFSPKHAEVARANFVRAGVADKIAVHVGPALDTLPKLLGGAPYDLVFIDADKENNANYLGWALKLTRPGSVIICDNVVREGRVLEAASSNGAIIGTRALYDAIAREPRLTATAIQTAGAKGWDGFAIAVVD